MGTSTAVAFGADQLSADQCDAIALNERGVIGALSGGYGVRGHPPVLPGGWACKWVVTPRVGNRGKLVLVPTDGRTRRIYWEGQVRGFQALGLTREDAEIVYFAKGVSFQHELAPLLAEVLADEGMCRAMLIHPRKFGAHTGKVRSRWAEVYRSRMPAVAGLSKRRLLSLIKLFDLCYAGKRRVEYKPPTLGDLVKAQYAEQV